METAQFFGEYLICLDDAGRMLLPEEVRRQISQGASAGSLCAIRGPNQKIWLYRTSDFERLPSEADRSRAAMGWRIELDRVSRAKLPPKLIMGYVNPQDLLLIGLGDHLELWGRTEWKEYLRAILK